MDVIDEIQDFSINDLQNQSKKRVKEAEGLLDEDEEEDEEVIEETENGE